jgi:uncharacterized protein (TIGR02996 family)
MDDAVRAGEVCGMEVEQALWKAILEEPKADLPRLAYADWLEERGGEADVARAEFIRVQIEQARLPKDDPRQGELRVRAGTLWKRHGRAWFGPFLAECEEPLFLSRGFVDRVSPLGFREVGRRSGCEAVSWPLGPLPAVRVDDPPDEDEMDDRWDFKAVASLPGLASWGGLEAYKEQDDLRDELFALLRSPHLVNLCHFTAIRCLAVKDDIIDAFADAPGGFRLRSLLLDSCGVSDRGVHRLAKDSAFSELRELCLSESVGSDALVELLGSANLAQLRELALYGASRRFGPAVLRALIGSAYLGELRSLTLGFEPTLLAGDGAEQLAQWPGLARLQSLTFLGDVGLTDQGFWLLAQSPGLSGLRELHFSQCPSISVAYLALTESSHLANLERLRIEQPIPEAVRTALAARFGDRVVFDAG